MTDLKLHVGSGPVRLPGWTNIDNRSYPGVDVVLDVTEGLPFKDVDYIFAEHFIEHLSYEDALKFIKNCRRALRPEGVLRMSTPNLDWVWMTQYHLGQWANDGEAVRDCFWMNKGFRGWGHQFLYNFATLRETLLEAGFAKVQQQAYGISEHEALRNLEHHEQYPDAPNLPHIVVVDASGRQSQSSGLLRTPLKEYREVITVK